jgi:hypothetical protein
VCIFAYGQTGSGKTHTMSGTNTRQLEGRGINYRALDDLFAIRDAREGEVRGLGRDGATPFTISCQTLFVQPVHVPGNSIYCVPVPTTDARQPSTPRSTTRSPSRCSRSTTKTCGISWQTGGRRGSTSSRPRPAAATSRAPCRQGSPEPLLGRGSWVGGIDRLIARPFVHQTNQQSTVTDQQTSTAQSNPNRNRQVEVDDSEGVAALMARGASNRATSETKMNDRSSRRFV